MMRKIEKLMIQAIEALTTNKTNKGWSKDNTIVVNAGDRAKVFLHGNHIADVFYKGGLEVNIPTLCRWPSMTTRSRLRALGANLVSIKGTLHLNGVSIYANQ